MATSDYSGYSQNMENDRQRCKIKVRKFLFNILWRFGIMEENSKGWGGSEPSAVRVKDHGKKYIKFRPLLARHLKRNCRLKSIPWRLAEFYYNRGLQRPYTGPCTILQETINGFFSPLIVFLTVKHQLNFQGRG